MLLLCVIALAISTQRLRAAEELSVLFLGDQGHHRPSKLAEVLIPSLAAHKIQVTYTEDLSDLSTDNLKRYGGVILFANIDVLPAEQEKALLQFVADGGGFIPLHCASYCFRNSASFVELVGAQFQKHGGEVFATEIVQPSHAIMQGFDGFSSWDETYIHTKHNAANRIVLEVRKSGDQAAGHTEEPWTWVRTHGNGRVFYTAWGHDERTWQQQGFQNLVARGVRWACGLDPSAIGSYRDATRLVAPTMTTLRTDVAPFEYEEVGPKIPNYLAGEKWGVQGDVLTKMQKPLPAEESIKHFVTPENFHLELFVSEPDLQGKPIAMNWDERGRLWVCETIDYPNELRPAGQGRDRIRVCEDTDGDSKADKFTVFAEQLSIPTSLEFCHGGVIVQAGEETLFLRDNDGDGRADQRDVLISGWELGDTHGGVSNFQYGLDNHYWAMQGYNNSKPKYAGGENAFRMGPFRFSINPDATQPSVSQVEFIRSTSNNSWGLGISEEGLIFASTANRVPSVFVPIPNRYYERVRGWTPSLLADAIAPDHLFNPITDKVRQVDQHGGYTAGAGHALYTARNYPESWWNRVAFVCGPTGHLIGTFVLNRSGATYRDENMFNLVASDDEWSAPIMAEVGPDGNVWIVDWYNYIVQHNPTPQGFETGKGNAYESDLRDKKHGRIYRLVYDGDEGQAGASQPAKLDSTDVGSWVAALAHPNRLWRRHAQRLIVERGQLDVVPDLLALLQDGSVDSTNNNAAVNHALWTLHGLKALDPGQSTLSPSLLNKLLTHAAAGVRRNTLLTLPSSEASVAAIVASNLVKDKDAQVQLAALMALADMPPSASAGQLLARLSADATFMQDRFLSEGVICAAAMHADSFLTASLAGQPNREASTQAQSNSLRVVAEHVARNGVAPAALDTLLEKLATAQPDLATATIEGLANGWPRNRNVVVSAAAERAIVNLLEGAQQGTERQAQLPALLRLGSQLGSEKLTSYAQKFGESLLDAIRDSAQAVDLRTRAVAQLLSLVGSRTETVTELVGSIAPQLPPEVSSSIVRGLRSVAVDNVGSELVAAWPKLTPTLRADAVVVLLARSTTALDLLRAIADGKVAMNELSLDQRRTLENHPEREVRVLARQLLESSGVVVSPDRQRVLDDYASAAGTTGNAAAGKLLFTKNCANCHKHAGEGQEVGPDLTGMAVHPKAELMVHILDPNRSVEGNFRRYTLLTLDGQVLTGMLAAESQAAVELIDAEGKRKSISREDIDELISTNLSLMPAGFEQQLKVVDMGDLLEFLTTKGRFVPLPLASVATAISTKGLFANGDSGPDRMIFDDWSPKEFAGIPFQLVDPQGARRSNILLLNGPQGTLPPNMPKQVSLPCNMAVKSFHLLSGVSGWGFPFNSEKTTSMIVRIRYADGEIEDHPLLNGVHFADYIRQVDVPQSTFAFALGQQQIRYLTVEPKRNAMVLAIDLVKGDDRSAPMVMAITAERFE